MSITSDLAELIGTIIANLVDFENSRHNLFYQNKMQNFSDGGNCMILPIPGKINKLHDTTEYGTFLEDIVKKLTPLSRSMSKGVSKGITISQVGQYTVLQCDSIDPKAIWREIGKLDSKIRPSINSRLIEWYREFYGPEWQLILACFNNKQELKAQPLWIEYEPFDFSKVFYPGADSHNGEPPLIGKPVHRDHTLLLGTYASNSVGNVNFDPKFKGPKIIIDALWKLIENERFMMNMTSNGDWWGELDPVLNKTFKSFLLNTKKEYNAITKNMS